MNPWVFSDQRLEEFAASIKGSGLVCIFEMLQEQQLVI